MLESIILLCEMFWILAHVLLFLTAEGKNVTTVRVESSYSMKRLWTATNNMSYVSASAAGNSLGNKSVKTQTPLYKFGTSVQLSTVRNLTRESTISRSSTPTYVSAIAAGNSLWNKSVKTQTPLYKFGTSVQLSTVRNLTWKTSSVSQSTISRLSKVILSTLSAVNLSTALNTRLEPTIINSTASNNSTIRYSMPISITPTKTQLTTETFAIASILSILALIILATFLVETFFCVKMCVLGKKSRE